MKEEFTCAFIIICTFYKHSIINIFTSVVRKRIDDGAFSEFCLEEIFLVKKENDTCFDEPSGITDGVEEGESFFETVDGFIFDEDLIVFADCGHEDDARDVFETMDPLFSFGTLAADIVEVVVEVSNVEGVFGDTGGFDTTS